MACILFILLIIILVATIGLVPTAAFLVILCIGWAVVRELLD